MFNVVDRSVDPKNSIADRSADPTAEHVTDGAVNDNIAGIDSSRSKKRPNCKREWVYRIIVVLCNHVVSAMIQLI